jgi:hypothetical protein
MALYLEDRWLWESSFKEYTGSANVLLPDFCHFEECWSAHSYGRVGPGAVRSLTRILKLKKLVEALAHSGLPSWSP